MRVVVVGLGAVGFRAATQLLAGEGVASVTVVDRDSAKAGRLAARFGTRLVGFQPERGAPFALPPADVTVVATGRHTRSWAEAALETGSHVVTSIDDPAEVRDVLALDAEARERARSVVVGAAMAPGLSCVLATHGRAQFDWVEEIHVASMGTGGPACARRHHAALTSTALDWYDGAWRRRAGGSGRELVWFPEPVGGADCYRAGLVDPLLLVPAFEGARRVTSRLGATRRDRFTSWLPMLRPPHPEGLTGAVRVELRGRLGEEVHTAVLGVAGRPAHLAGLVAAEAARWVAAGWFGRSGAAGLAELVTTPGRFLRSLVEQGVTVAAFTGDDADRAWGVSSTRPS